MNKYDVIVVGAGHSGIEAALAPARMGLKTLVISLSKRGVGNMPCNPSVGGPAKGIVTREIAALGGEQGRAADLNHLQMKVLNRSKGPGVQALRVQADRIEYAKYMLKTLESQPNLDIHYEEVKKLIVKDRVIQGVNTPTSTFLAKAVILTTGTYMESTTMRGFQFKDEGPNNEGNSKGLSKQLKDFGFNLLRLKTGTPPRIHKDSINYEHTVIEPGTEGKFAFDESTTNFIPLSKQLPCYLTYTNYETHKIISANFDKSPMYNSKNRGAGPRYCPSIEDKVKRFSDKNRHQIFLEPESVHLNDIYVQGLSTSFPIEIQRLILDSMPALKGCKVLKWAYAIEYDAIEPTQLFPTLETKLVKNLYTAGQINGTSGYEEAAGQGVMAGINAALKIQGKEPLILKRDEAYIGVMIDDLVTKGTQEPYRLLTSRAEHRLLLRNDNAYERLAHYGNKIKLLKDSDYQDFTSGRERIDYAKKALANHYFSPKDKINEVLKTHNLSQISTGINAYELIRRPFVKANWILEELNLSLSEKESWKLGIEIKYEGYIKKQELQANRMLKLDKYPLAKDFNYAVVANLSFEAIEKLTKIKPLTIGQASRISGINPADIDMLMLHLKTK